MKIPTRQKLLNSATKLFLQKGYSATSVRDIAKDSGVNLSMVSYHFSGKEGLYSEVLQNQLNKVLDIIHSIKQEGDFSPPIERLKFYANGIRNLALNNENFSALMMMEFNNPTNIGAKVMGVYFSEFRNFIFTTIKDGVERGDFRDDIDIEHIAFCLVSILSFYNFIFRHLQSRKNAPPLKISDNYLDDAFSILFDGIKK